MKYYFITFFGIHADGVKHYWHAMIDMSPMKFIHDMNQDEGFHYVEFLILNVHEITVEEYNEWDGEFSAKLN